MQMRIKLKKLRRRNVDYAVSPKEAGPYPLLNFIVLKQLRFFKHEVHVHVICNQYSPERDASLQPDYDGVVQRVVQNIKGSFLCHPNTPVSKRNTMEVFIKRFMHPAIFPPYPDRLELVRIACSKSRTVVKRCEVELKKAW